MNVTKPCHDEGLQSQTGFPNPRFEIKDSAIPGS